MTATEIRDPDAKRWEDAEAKLKAWGSCCRRNAEIAGLPTMSFMVEILAHVHRQEKERRKERRKKIRELIRGKRERKEPIDAIEASEFYGHHEPEPTAKGKQSKGGTKPALSLDSESAAIDYFVRRQPKWSQKVLIRSYLYQQRDDDAADDIGMRPGEYAQRRRAAVQKVADWLETRYIRHQDTRRGG